MSGIIVFNEDISTKQSGATAENFSFINKMAVNLLYRFDYKKRCKKGKHADSVKNASPVNLYDLIPEL
ncbi:MAG TPA: hypothetical protein VGI82_10815 [Chitinophagaceae bacterium]